MKLVPVLWAICAVLNFINGLLYAAAGNIALAALYTVIAMAYAGLAFMTHSSNNNSN